MSVKPHNRGVLRRVRREFRAHVEGIVAAWPGGLGTAARRAFFARRLKSLGSNPVLGAHLLLIGPQNIEIGNSFACWRGCTLAACDDGAVVIGDRVSLNANVYVNACRGGRIEIGNDVMIGPNTVMRTSDHVTTATGRPMREQGHTPAAIIIDDDVWISANVTVLGGTRIGTGAVVAAGAVVTRDVAPRTIVGGVPARLIKMRPDLSS